MNTHAGKTQENKSQSAANRVSQKQSGDASTFQFVDNRPEGIAQRKHQELANNSPQMKQLRAFQEIANGNIIQRVVIEIEGGRFYSTITDQIYATQYEAQQAEYAELEGNEEQAEQPQAQAQQPPIYGAVPPPANYGQPQAPNNANLALLIGNRESGQISAQQFQRIVLDMDLETRRALQEHPQLANIPDALDFLE